MSDHDTSLGGFLAVVETGSNQQFIFSANKLRQIVGASQLIHEMSANHSEGAIVAAAGKVIRCFETFDEARALVGMVTDWALREAPGLDVCGVVEEVGADGFRAALDRAAQRLPLVRVQRPGPEARFARLPILADCATSGLPASAIRDDDDEFIDISSVALAKRESAKRGFERIKKQLKPSQPAYSLDRIETQFTAEDVGWLAVVHADGNCVGALTREHSESASTLGDFSKRLGHVGERALSAAVQRVAQNGKADVLPIVAGGDDTTVVVRGSLAIAFTVSYLEQLQRESLAEGIEMTGRAGIAFVKPHYPFHAAYELAERLSNEARANGQTAFDFHVLFDSNHADLDRIRARRGGVWIPYLVADISEGGTTWALLRSRWALLNERDNGELVISRSVAHELREAILSAPLSEAPSSWDSNPAIERLGHIHPEIKRLLVLDGVHVSHRVVLDAIDLISVGRAPIDEQTMRDEQTMAPVVSP